MPLRFYFLPFFAFPLRLLSSLALCNSELRHRNSKLCKSIANLNSALPFQCYPSHCCVYCTALIFATAFQNYASPFHCLAFPNMAMLLRFTAYASMLCRCCSIYYRSFATHLITFLCHSVVYRYLSCYFIISPASPCLTAAVNVPPRQQPLPAPPC